jgi:NAD-dependent dihydropyrimidine dehydrogenase PreA subunit
MPKITITVDEAKCIRCLNCVEVCPREVFDFDEKTRRVTLPNETECIHCRQCLELCDAGAISIDGVLRWKPKSIPPFAKKERILGYYPYYEVI